MSAPIYFLDTYLYETKARVQQSKPLLVEDLTEYKIKISSEQQPHLFHSLILDETIFHPQGGGQPSDAGIIKSSTNNFNLLKSIKDGKNILHIVSSQNKIELNPDEEVNLIVDSDKRLINASPHSAGHFIDVFQAQVEELKHLTPYKGSHFPGLSYVEYKGKIDNSKKDELKQKLQNKVDEYFGKEDYDETKVFFVPKEDERIQGFEISLKDIEVDFKEIGKYDSDKQKDIIMDENLRRIVFIGGKASYQKGCLCGGTHVRNPEVLKGLKIEKIQTKKGVTKITYTV
eukprot:snap_masked-scaffold_44-processed-gene-1.48-mRNA-1 protein AED:1.00 eAED:1.00 QI:0/-1/0/0/-1/1/1/0/286